MKTWLAVHLYYMVGVIFLAFSLEFATAGLKFLSALIGFLAILKANKKSNEQ